MLLDAIILAGGRSSRLSGTPKAELIFRGRTLIAETVRAALDSAKPTRIVVVGGEELRDAVDQSAEPTTILFTREQPAFGGPAAGIGAGLSAIRDASHTSSPEADRLTLVLACDVPRVAEAIPAILASALSWQQDPTIDGTCARDDSGRDQYLLGIYRNGQLDRAIALLGGLPALDGISMRKLLGGLTITSTAIPPGTGADVDTWDDAARFGIVAKSPVEHSVTENRTKPSRPLP